LTLSAEHKIECLKCGIENPKGRKFCRNCGAKLGQTCSDCGFENIPGDKFCGGCGHDLRENKAVPSIDYSRPRSYIPKFLIDKILNMRSSMEGERKLVTVLFADVVNYTSISEKLDPEEVHQIMDGCFRLLMAEIHKYEGTIDKFTGDGVMALFGAPIASEDHAQRACYAALAIQRTIGEYGDKVRRQYGVDFKMRAGLNSGPVIVGAIGSDLRMDYTAIGDTTNLAFRMQGIAKPSTIVVSADTYKIVKDFFTLESLGEVTVKGKEEPVDTYRLIEPSQLKTRLEAAILKGLTKFVGRHKEIETLKEAYKKAQSGYGQVVGIVGEAGVGKSRLLLELRRLLHQENYTYLEGRCLHYVGSMPYLPILDILKFYFNIEEGKREFVVKRNIRDKVIHLDEKLKDILPPLHEILSLPVDNQEYVKLEPSLKREKAFEAIRNLLIRESQNKPLIVAVEDAQWIDTTSEEFLTYFIDWLPKAHILLIILYRPGHSHEWVSKSYYRQIGLDQLSSRDSARLVESMLKDGEVAPELKQVIISKAGGNALFVEELTRALVENGSIKKMGHEYVLCKKASDVQVPDTIQGIIAARIDRLDLNLKQTLQVASVIGRDFPFRLLQTTIRMKEDLKPDLLRLQGLEFIYEKSLFPELEYTFKHALTQEVTYNGLLTKRRKKIHETIGKAIEELYPDRLENFYEMLAHHYSKGDNHEKAYEYLRLSGDKASRKYANWEAFKYYRDAMNMLNMQGDTEANNRRKIEVCLSVENTMRILGYPEDSLIILQEGEKIAREFDDKRSSAIIYSSIGLYYSFHGDVIKGTEYAEHCLSQAEEIQDVDLVAPVGFNICASYSIAGQHLKIVEVAPRMLTLLEKTGRESDCFGGPLNLYSAFLAYYALSLGVLGDFAQAEIICERALRSARDLHNLYNLAAAETIYGFLCLDKGDGEAALTHVQNAIKHTEEVGLVALSGLNWMQLGYAYCLRGRLEEAKKHLETAAQVYGEGTVSMQLSQCYYCLGLVHFNNGDMNSALKYVNDSLSLSLKNQEIIINADSKVLLGRILGRVDISKYREAEANILQGIGELETLKAKPKCAQGYLFLGEFYSNKGHREKALECLRRAQTMFQDMGMEYWLCKTQKVLSETVKLT
jgi:class 3 adenylate cyclase/tetratricopeptide (TPR) repeat protein